jgi:hypothetical protein
MKRWGGSAAISFDEPGRVAYTMLLQLCQPTVAPVVNAS